MLGEDSSDDTRHRRLTRTRRTYETHVHARTFQLVVLNRDLHLRHDLTDTLGDLLHAYHFGQLVEGIFPLDTVCDRKGLNLLATYGVVGSATVPGIRLMFEQYRLVEDLLDGA